MSLLSFLVPVAEISCSTEMQVDPGVLQHAAQLILDSGGVINPLVLRRTGIDSYELVAGQLEYYAAVEAQRLNPKLGQLINAHIIESESERKNLTDQVRLFRHDNSYLPPDPQFPPVDGLLAQFETIILTLEHRLNFKLKSTEDLVMKRLKDIEDKIGHNPPPPNDEFIQFLNQASAQAVRDLGAIVKPKIKPTALEQLIQNRQNNPYISEQDVLTRLKGSGFGPSTYKNLETKWKVTNSKPSDLPIIEDLVDHTPTTNIDPSKIAPQLPSASMAPPPSASISIVQDLQELTAAIATLPADPQPVAASPAIPSTSNDSEQVVVELAPAPEVQPIDTPGDETISLVEPSSQSNLSGVARFNAMNKLELAVMLKRLKLKPKIIEEILKQQLSIESFDTIKIQGVGKATKEALKKEFS